MSPTVILIFGIISPKPCRRCIWIILSTLRRRYIIFDDDLGHGNHSGELLLFVGCIVNFIISYLICMFQDSVPAGSYNDPFLSSVYKTLITLPFASDSRGLLVGRNCISLNYPKIF